MIMARDPLITLIKVRRLASDEAQRQLVNALNEESRAERIVQETERVIAQEMETASDPNSSDAVVEAFGAWLGGARRQLETARRMLLDRQAETIRVRAELTATRTALESVEALQEQRRQEAQRAQDQRLQRELEDRPAPEREPEEMS